jgi:hypothetical protein
MKTPFSPSDVLYDAAREQQRIVDELYNLSREVDEMQDRAKKVLELLDRELPKIARLEDAQGDDE